MQVIYRLFREIYELFNQKKKAYQSSSNMYFILFLEFVINHALINPIHLFWKERKIKEKSKQRILLQ